MSGRGHRRFLSEPTYSDFNIGNSGRNGTFDDLDFDEFFPVIPSGDFKISPSGAGPGHMKSDIYDEIITGTKHSRSGDNDDEETDQPINRLSADFGKSTRQPSAKTASTASHRRVRSMPEVDLRMFDLFVAEPHSNTSTTCYDAMLPALNSMTVGSAPEEGTDLAASSADWTETWGNKILEDDKPEFLDFGAPASPIMNYFIGQEPLGTGSPVMSTQKKTPTDRSPCRNLMPAPLLPQGMKAEEDVPVRQQSLSSTASTDSQTHVPVPYRGPVPTHRRSHTTGEMMVYPGDMRMDGIRVMPQSMAAQFYAGGIADTEIHLPRPRHKKTDDFIDLDDRKGARGKYRCGRCGQPKVNHDCPFVADISTRSTSTQVERPRCAAHNHPFLTERTITVRGWQQKTGPGTLRPAPAASRRPPLDNIRFSDIRIIHPSLLATRAAGSSAPSMSSMDDPL